MSFVDLQKLFNHNNIMLLPKSSQNIKNLVKYKKFPLITPREHAQYYHSPLNCKRPAKPENIPIASNFVKPEVKMLKDLFKEKFEKIQMSKYPYSSLNKKPVNTTRNEFNKKTKNVQKKDASQSKMKVVTFKRIVSRKPFSTRKNVTRPPTPITCASSHSNRPVRTPDAGSYIRHKYDHSESDEDRIDDTTYSELYSKYL